VGYVKDRSIRINRYAYGNSTYYDGIPNEVRNNNPRLLIRTREGVSLPKYKKVISAGLDATTPMEAYWDSLTWKPSDAYVLGDYGPSYPTYRWVRENRGDTLVHSNQISVTPVGPFTQDLTLAENLARRKFYKKVRQASTQFNGATFAGELGETLRMLRHPLNGLKKNIEGYLDTLKNRKRRDPRYWTQAISGTWLEYAFGWKPFINDMEDLVSAIERINELKLSRRISASAKIDIDLTKTNLNSTCWNNVPASYNGGNAFAANATLVQTGIVRYRGAVSATVERTGWDNFNLFGFKPEDWIPAAWELCPWSFLIDYVTNIGDILESATTVTSNVTYTNKTVRTDTDWKQSGYMVPSWNMPGAQSSVLLVKGGLGYASANRRYVSRQKIEAVPLPTFQIDFNLSRGQLFNVAALLTQTSRTLRPQNVTPLSHLRGMPRYKE